MYVLIEVGHIDHFYPTQMHAVNVQFQEASLVPLHCNYRSHSYSRLMAYNLHLFYKENFNLNNHF